MDRENEMTAGNFGLYYDMEKYLFENENESRSLLEKIGLKNSPLWWRLWEPEASPSIHGITSGWIGLIFKELSKGPKTMEDLVEAVKMGWGGSGYIKNLVWAMVNYQQSHGVIAEENGYYVLNVPFFSAEDAERIFSTGDNVAEEILREVITPLNREAKAHNISSSLAQLLCRENALVTLMSDGFLPPLPEIPPPPTWGVWGAAGYVPFWEEITEEAKR